VTRDRVVAAAIASAIAGAGILLALLLGAHGTVDAYGRPLGTDFSVFWNAGQLANGGHPVSAWSPALLNAAARATHGPGVPASAWLYPPVFLFVASALARLPYLAALLSWQGLSLLLAAAILSAVLKDRRAMLVALASPLSVEVLDHGQNAFLTMALLGFGLLLLGRKPLLAGACLGALLYKPQLALMLGPMLLFGKHWRAIAAAAFTAAVLIGISTLLWGTECWRAFFASLHFGRAYMEEGAVPFWKSAGLFAMARQWGAGVPLAYTVQAIGALSGLLLVWRVRTAAPLVRNAATCAAIALSTPYLLDYDMTVVGLGAAFLYRAAAAEGFRAYERSALALIWIAPWFARPAAEYLTLPLEPLATVLLAFMAVQRLSSRHRHSAVHMHRLPRHVAGLPTGKIDAGRADVLASTHLAEGDA
jgi:hypothetical protein